VKKPGEKSKGNLSGKGPPQTKKNVLGKTWVLMSRPENPQKTPKTTSLINGQKQTRKKVCRKARIKGMEEKTMHLHPRNGREH